MCVRERECVCREREREREMAGSVLEWRTM